MKVVPSNQTLILANERPNLSGSPGKLLGQALTDTATGSVLKRVTIVAAQPDTSMVYVQADYLPADSLPYSPSRSAASLRISDSDDADVDPTPVARALVPSNGSMTSSRHAPATSGDRDAFGNLPSMNPYVGLYARTQSLLTDMPAYPHIDVLA